MPLVHYNDLTEKQRDTVTQLYPELAIREEFYYLVNADGSLCKSRARATRFGAGTLVRMDRDDRTSTNHYGRA